MTVVALVSLPIVFLVWCLIHFALDGRNQQMAMIAHIVRRPPGRAEIVPFRRANRPGQVKRRSKRTGWNGQRFGPLAGRTMADFVYVAITVAFFAISIAYVHFCDRIW